MSTIIASTAPPAPHSASLDIRQKHDKFELPTWGSSITAGELIAFILQREGTRDDALETLAQTLADLGITGEEIAHWQNCPGTCHDCHETDERHYHAWVAELHKFPQEPFEYGDTYFKKDGPSGRKRK